MRSRLFLIFAMILLSTAYLLIVVPNCIRLHPDACLPPANSPPLAPGVYRILQPAIEHLIVPNATPLQLLWADLIIQVAAVMLIVPLLDAWLRRWTNADRALIGVLIFTAIYLVALHFYLRAISTTLEILSVVIALLLLDKRWGWFVPLVILASLNRETSLLIVALFAVYHGRNGLKPAFVLLAIWGVITAGLHIIIGPYPHMLGLEGTLAYNLDDIPGAIIANLLFLPIGITVLMGYRTAPAPLRKMMWLAGAYGLAIVVGASWSESQRLVLPIVPLLLPLILSDFRSRTVVNPA